MNGQQFISGTRILVSLAAIFAFSGDCKKVAGADRDKLDDYVLVWSDEFNEDGRPNPNNWNYERGFVRNEELQWYQPDNACCEGGGLVIEGRRERVPNPRYSPNGRSWKQNRDSAAFSSACLKTSGLHQWTFGRFEMRGRIDTRPGLWPAFWTLGSARGWPGCGEIDIMEYYRGMLLANACWDSGQQGRPVWDDTKKPIEEFKDSDWSKKYHVWRMDWDEQFIRLFVDDLLLNTIDLSETINKDGKGANPFHEPHYLLLNLAIGGTQGGDPAQTEFPARFEVDYVRVYQKPASVGKTYPKDGTRSTADKRGQWVDISAKVLQRLSNEGKTIGYPGKTAGITVDRTTGDVFMVIPDQGIWRSTDRGDSYVRVDGGKIGGRCETGFSLNFDPLGKRLACFMLDGPSGFTLDGGKTWQLMEPNQRGWDAGSVQWSADQTANIFALRHECGGEIYVSCDMGKQWKLKGNAFASVGIFDAETFVATREKEPGIFRSTDGGQTWVKVSDLQPSGRDIRILNNTAYWTSGKGLLVSRDRGATWAIQGQEVECSFGPYFGKDEMHIVVVGKNGFFVTSTGGKQWEPAAPLPPDFSVTNPGWFLNFGWNPHADIFYASCMGKPAYRFQR